MTLRLGTRGSALALAQSGTVAAALTAATGEPVELVEIVTDGDRSAAPVQQLGVGVFVSALREALHAKEIDFAVHSYKDLPTAAGRRPDHRGRARRGTIRATRWSRATVPCWPSSGPGTRIGTGAPRRVAQLRRAGPRADVRAVARQRRHPAAQGRRRRASTRSSLAAAGLRRLGRADEITEILDPMLMLPAPAQGALAVECRAGDHSLVELLASLDDEHTRAAVTAERSLLATLEAGCSAPVAALADVAETDDGAWEIYLRGAVFSPDGELRHPAVRHRNAHRRRRGGLQAGRRARSPRAPITYWESMHDPHPQDRWPDQLRRSGARRSGPAHPPRRRGAARGRPRGLRPRRAGRAARLDPGARPRRQPTRPPRPSRTDEATQFSPAEGVPGDVAKVLLSAARSGPARGAPGRR